LGSLGRRRDREAQLHYPGKARLLSSTDQNRKDLSIDQNTKDLQPRDAIRKEWAGKMTDSEITFGAVMAGVQSVIAEHAQAQDDGRTDDIMKLYCHDGVLEVPGMGTYEGADAIRAAWDAWKPRTPQRHIVTNTLVTEWSDHQARATSDVVFVQKGESGWGVQMVARYHDSFRREGNRWLLSRREDEYIAWDPPAMSS
jgi:ketosteroid isomerase-like protein